MVNFFVVLFYIFVIIRFIKFITCKQQTPTDVKRNLEEKVNNKRYSTINSHYSVDTLKSNTDLNKKHNFIPSVNITPAEKTLRDDKRHDWLAIQLAEERRAYRRINYMFDNDLSLEHSLICDADGIDNGLGK